MQPSSLKGDQLVLVGTLPFSPEQTSLLSFPTQATGVLARSYLGPRGPDLGLLCLANGQLVPRETPTSAVQQWRWMEPMAWGLAVALPAAVTLHFTVKCWSPTGVHGLPCSSLFHTYKKLDMTETSRKTSDSAIGGASSYCFCLG